jgi:photosynthetic reaction center H subunit
MSGSIVGSLDVAQVVLYTFWIFFAGLVWYIRQEDRREGYPLEDDVSGGYNKRPWLFIPDKKTFVLPHGQGIKQVPDFRRDELPLNAERMSRATGYPSEPTGNPMLAGVGPGAWAPRQDIPDLTAHGDIRIVPMRVAIGFDIAAGEIDPRGLPVMGCDQVIAGTVIDVWVDRSEQLIRYYEIELVGGERSVLLPNNFVVVRTGRGKMKYLYVHAVTAQHFGDVPAHAKPEVVTRLEEDKIAGYFGGGLLYAVRDRREALL